ncbi:MAG: hypothetical protein JXA11_15700, partial [Phycisphaerae bacterium]|nr:hypothetical protein [Phycisphaerae bacterium]
QLRSRGRVIPWMTPGDWGMYLNDQFTWALMECFANGATGVYFWSHNYWDIEHLMGFARALKIVHPVQDVIAEGKPLSGVGGANGVRVRGMVHGDETFFIVADYRLEAEKTVRLTVPVTSPVPSEVVDLATGLSVGQIDDERNILTVTLTPNQRLRAFHVRPIQKSN